jgi:hypothetical protein
VHRVLAVVGQPSLQVSNRMCPSASLHHWVRRVKRFLTRRGEPYAFRLTGYRPRTFLRLLEDVGSPSNGRHSTTSECHSSSSCGLLWPSD